MADDVLGVRNRLDRIEANLRAVCAHLGIAYDEGSTDGVPPEVLELVRADRRIEAIKALREATGMGLAEAKGVVDTL